VSAAVVVVTSTRQQRANNVVAVTLSLIIQEPASVVGTDKNYIYSYVLNLIILMGYWDIGIIIGISRTQKLKYRRITTNNTSLSVEKSVEEF
jgi:hypothetical protein